MWLIQFLPDPLVVIIIDTLLGIGVLSFIVCFFFINRLVRWIPGLASHYLLLQIISVFLLTAGVYFKGGYVIESKWRAEVEKLQEKIKIAEENSKNKNTEIVTVYKDKIKVIRKVVKEVKKEIEEKKVYINEGCTVSPTAVEMYNKAVKGDKQ